MLKKNITKILVDSKKRGWVLEPEAKRILSVSGFKTPKYLWTVQLEEALRFSEKIGYPVAAKVVSPKAIHKSDVGGVETGISDAAMLTETYNRFKMIEGFSGILVEEMVIGTELIIGAKIDYQFGPVILLGMGGTGVEVYQDTTIRMAPLGSQDAEYMINGLKARSLLTGYRGSDPINLLELSNLLVTFSELVMAIQDRIESIDLNPVMCTSKECVIADARIILKG